MVVEGECGGAWGTWEELILGAAVLRHGTQAWAAVASELQGRTPHPASFTPEVCEAKYNVLQQDNLDCNALLEELRKRRIERLKIELKQSDDKIGFFKKKIEKLEAEKESHSQIDSPTPLAKPERVESLGKDSSKDGLSASSVMQDISKIAETILKQKPSFFSYEEIDFCFKKRAQKSDDKEGTFKKKRGRRKRKDCNEESKQGSNESADIATSAIKSPDLKNLNVASPENGNDDLMGIFYSVAETDVAHVFRRKLDSQKRAKYRKLVRRHLDFDTLKSMISNRSILSVKQLFRDLLLLSNNALVFYSKRTREHKAALLLRDIITKSYKNHCRPPSAALSSFSILPELFNHPKKPRSVRPRPHKTKLTTTVSEDSNENSLEDM